MPKTYFEFVNSFGDQWGDPQNPGFGYIPTEYVTAGYLSNPYTLVDARNIEYGLYQKLISTYKNIIQLLLKK